MSTVINKESSSFRDPSGFIFRQDGHLYRQVNLAYKDDYDHLMGSGLYKKLTNAGMMIPHSETEAVALQNNAGYKIIAPQEVPFISYPYEWSFSQLKDAALLTLEIQQQAMKDGMTLKDASAYNVQFVKGRPMLIDTLSFTRYVADQPWVAYRQFCQHFLCPLALMGYREVRLNKLMQTFIDGIPLELASRLLPKMMLKNTGIWLHIHMHAYSQQNLSGSMQASRIRQAKVKKEALEALCDSLRHTVDRIRWNPGKTYWADYYKHTNYQHAGFEFKKNFIRDAAHIVKPRVVWDLGANTGIFSRQCADLTEGLVVSSDYDAGAVEINYLENRKANIRNILPLVVDLNNPSPDIGWENRERISFIERGPADLVLALALVHHLAISNNLPLARIASFLARVGKNLVIEFISKDDSQVQKLLATRDDIFTDYSLENFVDAFSTDFVQVKREQIPDSMRELFLFSRR